MGGRLLVGVAVGVMVAACADTPAEEATSEQAPAPAPDSEDEDEVDLDADPVAEPVLVWEDLPGFEPRGVVFANVEFTVTGVRLSNQTLRSYAEGGAQEIDEDALYAYLDVTAVNRMTSMMTERLGPGDYKLVVGDQQLDAVDELGFLSHLTGFILANTGVDSFLAFRVDEGVDLADGILLIGSPPDRQASLPLAGEVPAATYPIEVAVAGSAQGASPTNPGTIEFTLLGATLSEDQPHERATSPTGLRANEDELFLVVHVRAEKVSGGGPDHLGTGAFRLLVDGVPRAPWDSATDPHGSDGSPVVDPGAAVDAFVAFMIPTDATELALQAGDFNEDPAILGLELPPLP